MYFKVTVQLTAVTLTVNVTHVAYSTYTRNIVRMVIRSASRWIPKSRTELTGSTMSFPTDSGRDRWPIIQRQFLRLWVTLKAWRSLDQLLQTFSNKTFCTAVQQLTTFQLAKLCDSSASSRPIIQRQFLRLWVTLKITRSVIANLLK